LNTIEVVAEILCSLKAKIVNIELGHNEFHKECIIVVLDTKASKAMDTWLKLIDKLKEKGIDTPVFVYWTRETDLAPEELGKYIAKALVKMNLFLATKKPLNSVELIEEEWE